MLNTLTPVAMIPHGHCYLWQSSLIWLHLLSDLAIALAYYSIPITLVYFVWKRTDLPHPSIFFLFGMFIISCGTTHLMEIWTIWHPNYWIEGYVKLFTAVVSLYTAFETSSTVPKALAIPSSAQLEAKKLELEREILERQKIELQLRQSAEEALRESERRFRAIFDQSYQFIGLLKPDGTVLETNQSSLDFGGIRHADIVGRPFWEAGWWTFSSQTQKQLKEAIAQAATGEFVRYEVEVSGVDNQIATVDFSLKAIKDETGQVVLLIPEGRDISERKSMEISLRESEERFRLAFEDAAVGMALVAPDGRFLKINRSLCEIFGYNEEELQAINSQAITYPDDLEGTLNYVRRMLIGEITNYQVEIRYIHKLRHIVWTILSFSLVRNSQGQPLYFISQIQDISTRKEAEFKIAESLQEKEVLLKEIHHRVKNNLQVICSLLNLQSRYLKDPLILEKFQETRNRVESMVLIHEQLYRSEKISKITLSEYLQALINNLVRFYGSANIVLKQEISGNFMLDVDTAVPCGLIINELISNAIKYAFIPPQTGEILIQAKPDEENNLVLIIKDNGKGLPANFSIEKNKTLGLKLVKNLIGQLRGKIEVDSKAGTQFKITLTRIKSNENNSSYISG